MIGVQADKTVDGRFCCILLIVLPVAISDIELRLLGVRAERITPFKAFEVFDALAVILAVERALRLRV